MVVVDIELQILIGIFVFVFSVCIGSFLNVVIYRLPNEMSLVNPPSHCPKCDYELKWYDNIPIFSYIFLGGKCRNCKKPISPQYLIIELLTGILAVCLYLRFGVSWMSLLSIVAMYAFIVIFMVDWKHFIIPYSAIITIASCGLIVTILGIVHHFVNIDSLIVSIGPIFTDKISTPVIDWSSRLIGLGIMFVIYLLVIVIEKLIKREFIGGGDLLVFMAVALFLGWELTILGIFFGSFIALMVEFPFKKLLKREKQENSKSSVLPFGPYLMVGFFISLIFGFDLINWYLSIWGF